MALSELRYEIELGIKLPEDLVAKLKESQSKITSTIVEEQKTIDALLSELGSEKGENQLTAERRAEIESEIKDRKKQVS
ncbi:MAG: hypothetical protein M9949_10740 [Candidatus Kapabacteria bacterium]|nr:hypothetical protein [Candidatus Kapabacteria bacterium]